MQTSPYFTLSKTDSVAPANAGCTAAISGTHQLFLYGRIFEIGEQNVSRKTADAITADLLSAYIRRGVRCFAECSGDFVVAICSSSALRTLTAYRSLTTQHQIYYTEAALSTGLVQLAGTLPHFAIDTDYFDRFLLGISALQYAMPATPIAGIRRLLPGELLELGADGVRLTRLDHRTYALADKPGQTVADVQPGLLALLQSIVGDRLPPDSSATVYSELSGGIDSSLVSALIAQSGRSVQFILYNYGEKSGSLSEQCARAVAGHYAAPLMVLPAEELAAVDLRDLDFPGDEPSVAYWQAATVGRALGAIVPAGHRVFSGFGADELFMRRAKILPAVLAQYGWRAALTLSREIGVSSHRSALNLLWQTMVCRLPPWLRGRFNTEDVDDLALVDGALNWLEPRAPGSASRWQNTLSAEGRAAVHACFTGGGVEISGNGSQFADMKFIAGPCLEPGGAGYETPFCDLRLIDFMARDVDWRLIFNWKETHKHLLREAARGILPESVRLRGSDALGVDGILRLFIRRNRDTLRSLAFQSDLPLENVDEAKLAQAFDAMCFGSTQASAHKVHALIGFSWWWRSFKNRMRMLA